MADFWNPAFDSLHPCFQQLQNIRRWREQAEWPAAEMLACLLPAGLCAQSGQSIRFLRQDETLPFPELYYEERIFQHGVVATRANWHDFFNALIWALYPQTKVTINALHAADIRQYGQPRTSQRDALTVFDESGVVVAASRHDLLQLALDFRWEALFWQERAAWWQEIACFALGHATLEKLLTPYVGLTAHALLVAVEPLFFGLTLAQQQAYLDGVVAANLQQGGLRSPAQLNPFPLLGVPGWWVNDAAAFYRNERYFRVKTRERDAQIIAAY